ncbi:hypothetical protein [Methylobacter svalbardensis]|uniref:hypothetical protein n=1 Tax=Methylobacter svalbardensis TaxID=3080016 RepID=UPI0030EE559C
MTEKSSKSDWKSFFTFENELLDFLSQQKFMAGDKADLKYLETPFRNTIIQRPPKFLHAVISLGGNESLNIKTEADIEELKSRYVKVSSRGFPARFPQLLKQPLQINLSQHEAFRSRVISAETNDFIPVKRYNTGDLDNSSIDDIAALRDIGIKAKVYDKAFGKTLNISSNDLILYTKAKILTVRESSGNQYIARVRYPDSYQSVRMSYGLLIIPDDCPTLHSLPQARRTHRLETSKEKIMLPIDIDSEIFIKEP